MLNIDNDPNHTIRVVVADNDDADRKSVLDLLRADNRFVVESVTNPEGLMALLDGRDVDCVVVDQVLGTESGFAIHDWVVARYPNPPAIVMLTASGDERIAIKAFRCGFSNYVRKKALDARELITAILHSVRRRQSERQQRAEMERLAKLALRDRITGLPNRQFLEERLSVLIASGKRLSRSGRQKPGKCFAILTIDIDAFKAINDSFGHAVGDLALIAFADRLRRVARASDVFGRLGDDEFLYVIESDASTETVELACRRLADVLSFSIELEAVGLELSPSIGAAIYPIDGKTAKELLSAADRAMRTAQTIDSGYSLAASSRRLHEAGLSADHGMDRVAAAIAAQSPELADPAARKARSDEEFAFIWQADRESGVRRSDDAPVAHDEVGDRPAVHREENRRNERRNRVLKRGKILALDGFSTIDCVIRDLSQHGARVVAEVECATQPRFSLLIVDSGLKHPAERRWQRGREIGVRFVD